MKTFIALISSAMLLATAVAYADNNPRNHINNQNLSKRPYQQAPEAQTKADNFEGATFVKEDSQAEKNQKTLQLHNLGRRPYAEKAPD
jgi:hypothetical protein